MVLLSESQKTIRYSFSGGFALVCVEMYRLLSFLAQAADPELSS